MATPRVESIMAAVVTNVTSLTTTGANVSRARVFPFHDHELPGLAVFMGDNLVQLELASNYIDWNLSVYIEAYVKSASVQIDTTLNTIRAEVHAALMADYTQGLAYVIETIPGTALQPVLSDEGNQPVAAMRMEYIITYRTSRNALDA